MNNDRDVVLDDARKALYHPGPNTIAVHGRRTSGGRSGDVGVTLLKGK